MKSSLSPRTGRYLLGTLAAALALVAGSSSGSALTAPTLPDPLPTIGILPTPTPTATPTPIGVVGEVTNTATGTIGSTTGSTDPATGPATDAAAPAGPPTYQPPPDEQQSLPNEPNRVAYEQQQSDVSYDESQLQGQLSPIAVEAGGGSGRFGWPLVVHGRPPITQRFGCTDLAGEPYKADCPSKRWHTGLDLAVPAGTPVFAADAGVVREFRTNQGYGNYALVIHGNGYATLYGHLSDFAVPDGTVVKRGEQLGFAGSTGFSTGPHLHFEIRYDGGYVDPCAELRC